MITSQFIFMVMSVVAFCVSVLLLLLAGAYYFRNDIRSVKNDLLGKTRQIRSKEMLSHFHTGPRSLLTAQRSSNDVITSKSTLNSSDSTEESMEDDQETMVNAGLLEEPQKTSVLSTDNYDPNDNMPTLVATEFTKDLVKDGVSFAITKSIVVIHSDELIVVD